MNSPYRSGKPFSTIEAAYENDIEFRSVVDMIESLIHSARLTPAEIRGAATLACIRYESRQMRPVTIELGRGARDALDYTETRIAQLRRWIDDTDAPEKP